MRSLPALLLTLTEKPQKFTNSKTLKSISLICEHPILCILNEDTPIIMISRDFLVELIYLAMLFYILNTFNIMIINLHVICLIFQLIQFNCAKGGRQ